MSKNKDSSFDIQSLIIWIALVAISHHHGPSWVFWLLVIPQAIYLVIAALAMFTKSI